MSRWKRNLSPILTESPSPSPGRYRESPDLLTRCAGGKLIDVGIIGGSERDDTNSPANHTDIIISDDETPSLDSDATIILDPDIIIDYDIERESNTLNSIPVAGCSTPKKEQPVPENVGMIRCKPLKDLLSEKKRSPSKVHVNDTIENGIDRIDDTRSSDSSSSSPIPPTPRSERLQSRRRIVVPSDSEDSDTALIDVVKKSSDQKTEQRIFQANRQPRSSGKLRNYRPMKEWSMHEATPPTSGSDESDDNSKTKRKQRGPEKSHSRNYRPSDSAESSVRKKFIPKYILDKNYRLKKIINAQTDESSAKRYNIRLTKENIVDEIRQSPNIRKTVDHSSVRNVMNPRVELVPLKMSKIVIEDRKYATVPNETSKTMHSSISNDVSVSDELMQRKSQKLSTRDTHRRWMQQHPNIEAKIRRDRDVPVGSTFCDWERLGMIWWLLKTDRILESRARTTWAQMQKDGYLRHRTVRSLQNHFVRKILPDLKEFSLPDEIVEEFEIIMS